MAPQPSPGLLGRLFGKAQPPPRGLYIWGGVGRGKSMLMDLFFDAVQIDRKRRAHFHEFMLDVHARLRHARETGDGDPIAPVAAKGIETSRSRGWRRLRKVATITT